MYEPLSPTSPTLRVSMVLHAVGLFFIGFILVASAFGWGDPYRWTADVATLTMAKPWDGLLSNLGMVIWSSAVAVAVFVAATWWKTARRQLSKMLLAGGSVTAVLLVDDLFMVHDELLPKFFGVPELIATIGVAAFPLAFLWIFREAIGETSWALLGISVLYLGAMAAVDAVEHSVTIPAHHVWEEGAKFLGILHWCGYMILVAWEQARSVTIGRTDSSRREASQ